MDRWRNRTVGLEFEEYHVGHEDRTKTQMDALRQKTDFLWVMCLVNKPTELMLQELQLREDEAVFSLEGAMSWCPTLAVSSSMIAVGSYEHSAEDQPYKTL